MRTTSLEDGIKRRKIKKKHEDALHYGHNIWRLLQRQGLKGKSSYTNKSSQKWVKRDEVL